MPSIKKRIAIIGGGPSGLFMYKRLIESGDHELVISIFERKKQLGVGMPYSEEGANVEHITNVSDNEIPTIVNPIKDWVKQAPDAVLKRFNITPANFNEYKVLPRLFFGAYLAAQFDLLTAKAAESGLQTDFHLTSNVVDVVDKGKEVAVVLDNAQHYLFDQVIICTGHNWPKKYEGKIPGYFDSPYPPAKLALQLNHPVAIKGSSLTAIDAIRTLSRKNGCFTTSDSGLLTYQLNATSEGFKMIMHSRNGLLPAVRFHLADSHLSNKSLLSEADIQAHRSTNNGFVDLDYIFEKDFKEILRKKDPDFYAAIKDMDLETFVEQMLALREQLDPFQLLKAEYIEAEQSIKRKESVYWKEMLAILSFSMNYPAKYLAAEDMIRLQKALMPLISIVIAFVPQSSCLELLALHAAGVLELISVGNDSVVKPEKRGGATYHYKDQDGKQQAVYYQTYIDCVGQPHLNFEEFPFKSLLENKNISPAILKFKDSAQGQAFAQVENDKVIEAATGEYYLKVPGLAINDQYRIVDGFGAYNERIFVMAVPYIGGYNPDYSGLDFGEAASKKIMAAIATSNKQTLQE